MKSRRGLKPQQQSKIDGMCGLYATLNACKYLFAHAESTDNRLFKALCQAIAGRFPRIMFEGTGTDGVRELLTAAAAWVAEAHRRDLHWNAPLWREAIAGPDEYFDRLRDLQSGARDEASVFIIGLGKPWNHWTVLTRCDSRRAYFFDSWGLGATARRGFTFNPDHAGEKKGKKILIDYHQTFMLRAPRL